VIPKSPAAAAGLKAGDVIVGINRIPTYDFKEVRDAIRNSNGQPIVVSVLRNGQYLELRPAKPQKTEGVYTVGFHPAAVKYKRYGPIAATGLAAKDTWLVTQGDGLVAEPHRHRLRSQGGLDPGRDRAPVEQGRRRRLPRVLQVLALISLSLALLNLLPLLPLDGGHMAFSIIEGCAAARSAGWSTNGSRRWELPWYCCCSSSASRTTSESSGGLDWPRGQ
jgi:regulator of sigma E protease